MTRDLRLFGPAIGVWVATLVALRVPATTTVGAGLGCGAVAGLLAWHTRRGGRASPPAAAAHGTRAARAASSRSARRAALRWAGVAVLLGAVCGALATAARTSVRDSEVLAALVASRATVRAELTVADDPRALTSSGTGPVTYLVPVRLIGIEAPARSVRLDVRAILFAADAAWRDLLPSARLAATVSLSPARGGDLTAAVLNASGGPELLAQPSWAQRAAGRLRAGLQAACAGLPAEPGGLLPGLVIGDTRRLDPALAAEFKTTGLTHLTAVSGANLAIVLGVVLFTARWCRAGPWLSTAICAVALVGFVILARPSPSVVRAAAMGAVGLLALATGRSRAAAPALAAAVMAALLLDPDLAVDAGFALSALATGALVLVAPRWCEALRARGWPAWLAAALAAPAAAQVACGPVIAALSGGVSLVAVPANLLASVAVAPATLLGVGAAVVSAVWPTGASLLAWLGCWPARWLVTIAHAGAGMPVATLPWPAGLSGALLLAATTVAVAVALRWPLLRRYLVVAGLAVAVVVVPLRAVAPGWPPAGAVLVACDVGQGDALVLPITGGQAVVVDTGPDPVPVDGCLSRLGVDSVALLVVTHFHADHVGGVAGVLRHRAVGQIVVPEFDQPRSGHDAVLRAGAGIPITQIGPGWTFSRGDLRLWLLGPLQRHTDTRSDPNNNSLVLRAQHGSVTILLTGDAETEEQHDLLPLGPNMLHADVLKVAHHGSSYQDPQFLAEVDPAVAVVSVGTGNPYGHPNPGLMSELTRDGAAVARTDLAGDVAVVATGGHLGLVTTRAPP